jgi:hypothetical protein
LGRRAWKPFPVQARRLFPSGSVEEVPTITLTGSIRPATPPAADDEPLTRRPPMVVRKRSTKAPRNPYLTSATPDELSPANRIAHDIVAERRDLLPSVERIMNAGLNEDGTVGVLTLFRCSLTAAGDPNRDPRVAIATYSPASANAVATTADA